MRVEKDVTIDEIAERLAISRQTIFHWVRDLPLQRERLYRTEGLRARAKANSARYKAKRDAAYAQGLNEYDELVGEPTFRDFVCMYIGEGSKRCRHTVAICNSNSRVLVLAHGWIKRFTRNGIRFALQYHADQDPVALRAFWGQTLQVDPDAIRLQRKSNSNQLAGRLWRSPNGVLTIETGDTYFRARLQTWMDRISAEWIDSAV